MDLNNFFDGPLKLGKNFGFLFNFAGAKLYQKLLALCTYFGLISLLIFRIQYLLGGQYNIEDLPEVTSNTLANIEAIMKVSSFYIYKEQYLFLMEEMSKKLRKGLYRWVPFWKNPLVVAKLQGHGWAKLLIKRRWLLRRNF